MTGDFVYEALLKELIDWRDNCDNDKYNLIYDYIRDIAYEMWVRGDETPAWIVDNLVVNWDFCYEWDDNYKRALRTGNYQMKWDWIILL